MVIALEAKLEGASLLTKARKPHSLAFYSTAFLRPSFHRFFTRSLVCLDDALAFHSTLDPLCTRLPTGGSFYYNVYRFVYVPGMF